MKQWFETVSDCFCTGRSEIYMKRHLVHVFLMPAQHTFLTACLYMYYFSYMCSLQIQYVVYIIIICLHIRIFSHIVLYLLAHVGAHYFRLPCNLRNLFETCLDFVRNVCGNGLELFRNVFRACLELSRNCFENRAVSKRAI